MERTNKKFIINSLRLIEEDSQIASYTRSIIAVWSSFSGEKISYIGFNFEGGDITSIKLYFVLYSDELPFETFPIPPLAQEFLSHWKNKSNFVNEPLSNGGGLTFSIKVDRRNLIEYGYYLRCAKLNDIEHFSKKSELFGTSFINATDFGIYNTFKNNVIQSKIYGYVTPAEHPLDAIKELIQLQNVRGIEIARIDNDNDQKYICLGGENVFTSKLESEIPKEIHSFQKCSNLKFICPAFSSDHKLCSVYVTSRTESLAFPSVAFLINNYQNEM